MNHSPVPTPVPLLETTMDFPTAMRHIIDGKGITRLEWGDDQFYCVLSDTTLLLHEPDGKFYQWTINHGDLLGTDWVIVDHH